MVLLARSFSPLSMVTHSLSNSFVNYITWIYQIKRETNKLNRPPLISYNLDTKIFIISKVGNVWRNKREVNYVVV